MRRPTTRGARGTGRHVPRRPASPGTLVAVVLALGSLTGCGDQAREVRDAGAYAGRVNAIQTRFEADLRDVRRAADRAEVRADVRRAVDRLADRTSAVEGELRAARPPATVADAHRGLIVAFGRWTPPLREFRRALRDRDPRATLRARSRFGTQTAAVERGVAAAAARINDELRSLSD